MRRVGGQPCRPQLSRRSRLDCSHHVVGNAASNNQDWDNGDGGRNEISRREYLKVAFDLRVHSREIENFTLERQQMQRIFRQIYSPRYA